MKKKIFIVLVFILSINIFAKTNVEKQVEKIREEFTKINSEETGGHSGNEVIAEYYKKNGELKKVVVYADATLENYAIQYYFKDDEVFLSMNLKMNTK